MSAPTITTPGTAGGGVPVGGSGATGYVAKWTAATTLGGSATSGANASLFVDATGNVGIGTASPAAPMHLFGNSTTAVTTATAGILRINGSATNQLFFGSLQNSPFGMYAQTNDVTYPIVLQPAGGNVGVGTTSPTAALHLPAGTTGRAALNLTAGVAPSAPNNGDIWFDGTNIQMRVGGVTKTFTLV